jgi:NADH-quinone oxidoreductase subunit L
LPLFISLAGIGLAIIIYGMMPSVAGGIARLFRPIHQLFYRKWYFDEIYDAVFVRPAVEIGRVLWIRGDKDTIDGFGPDGISNTVNRFSAFCSRMQSGYVFHYAFAMLIGVIALLAWYIRSL